MDEFFVAVERVDNPSLRGKCVLVGGDPKGRGVVSTASYEARKYGCHSAMPMVTALALCPDAIILPPRPERYGQVSRQIFEIFDRYSPVVEPLSIDEAFIDVTGCECLHGPAERIARDIQATIADELHLSASVGVAPNKFLAKLASDLDKPAGLVVITEQMIHDILDPLPVTKLWGVGKRAAGELARLNIQTIGQLRRTDPAVLTDRFGQAGEHFANLANGIDDRPVTPDGQAKSIGTEMTFAQDIAECEELRRVLLQQVEQVARRLRQHELRARTVTVKLRTGDFTTLTRSRTLDEATDGTETIWQAADGLFGHWSSQHFRPLRLIGVTASQLTSQAGQLSLFTSDADERQQRIDLAMDAIVERFGPQAARRGGAG